MSTQQQQSHQRQKEKRNIRKNKKEYIINKKKRIYLYILIYETCLYLQAIKTRSNTTTTNT